MLEKVQASGEAERTAFEGAVQWGWANFCARQGITDVHKHDASLISAPKPAAHAVIAQPNCQLVWWRHSHGHYRGSHCAQHCQSVSGAGYATAARLWHDGNQPVISVVTLQSNDPSTVGEPLPCVEVRIGAQRGLQVRGPHCDEGVLEAAARVGGSTDRRWLAAHPEPGRTGQRAYSLAGALEEIIVTSTGEKLSRLPIWSCLCWPTP